MSPSVTSLFWMGDQLTTFDRYDGMHSALIGLLNGGYSGFSIGHSDIGGYTTSN
jgi:alpha-glucosidase (family GH31 glycosyl hydrolase)